MDSIKHQKEIAERLKFTGAQLLGGEFQSEYNNCCESAVALWPELLNWAERARFFIEAYKEDCKIYEGTEGLVAELQKLLEELPE